MMVHTYTVGNTMYSEAERPSELRAVGFRNNQAGDVTENELRQQLKQPIRIGYNSRQASTFMKWN